MLLSLLRFTVVPRVLEQFFADVGKERFVYDLYEIME